MLSGLTMVPKKVTKKNTRVGIDTLIFLKQALHLAPSLASVLLGMKDRVDNVAALSLIETLAQNFGNPVLHRLLEKIGCIMTESTSYSKSAHEMRNQECFALKTGINGLLDVSRKTFLQAVEDLYRVLSLVIYAHKCASRPYYLSLVFCFCFLF